MLSYQSAVSGLGFICLLVCVLTLFIYFALFSELCFFFFPFDWHVFLCIMETPLPQDLMCPYQDQFLCNNPVLFFSMLSFELEFLCILGICSD